MSDPTNGGRNLPIKFFEKRSGADERLTEGGGNDQPPKWVLEGDELRQKSTSLIFNVHSSKSKIEQKLKKHNHIPAVLKAKVADLALAKSHRSEFANFFFSNKQDRLIGFSENQELLIRIDTIAQLNEITAKLNHAEKNAKIISGLESIEAFDATIETEQLQQMEEGTKIVLRVQLFDYKNPQINAIALEEFKKIIIQYPSLSYVKAVKYTESLQIHRVHADDLKALEEIEDFNALFSIEPMPRLEVVDDDFFSEEAIQIPLPDENTTYPIVGILDSGIADVLKPWVVGKRHTNYPPSYLNLDHGTFVAGIVAFGDLIEEQELTNFQGCKFIDCAIYPDRTKETIYEDDLISNTREAIEKHSEHIKIWNMSLGMGYEAKHSEFSKLGIALDSIQDENDVLIIKSAGNCRNFIEGKPNSRIAGGADSVRALTVGSIALSKAPHDIAEKDFLSPFSRIGPGPANIIKPDLVHYGGNAGIRNGKVVPSGVSSLSQNGLKITKIGTSFSTPRVTSIAADLDHKLKEDFDPLLLKALLLHSSKYPGETDLAIGDKLNYLGFGLPASATDILFNDPNEITLIIRDTLNKGEFTEILDFPFPQSLVDQDHYYGQIIVTLVSHPVLLEGQGPEYCQSNIEVKLGTYDQKKKRDLSKRTIRNELGRDGGENLLRAGRFSRKKPRGANLTFANTERMLVQYGDKFYPNKKYAIDLSELTPGNKKHAHSSKSWYLKIEGLYRDFSERTAEYNKEDLSQEYCVVITIRDPLKRYPVYTDVTRLLDTNNFVHRNIQIDQNINIEGNN
ncbi:S8 family peptidase [Paenibacillus jamilae]|uniref:S8 family peptidase n=1 Tax=Paenibacillus jamilae TaxID=114136 RepID=UPI003D26A78F